MNRLIAQCKPLDPNSLYCNLLQCTHFADTCAIAHQDNETLGFLSAYIPPGQPNTIFVWQVAVSEKARGQGLGKRLIREVLMRPACREVAFLEASITESNRASWNLFLSIAADYGCGHEKKTLFERNQHFGGMHETETLLRIGPFRAGSTIKEGSEK